MRFSLRGLTADGPTIIQHVQFSVSCTEKADMPTVLDNLGSDIAFDSTGNTTITDSQHIAANKSRKSVCICVIVKEYNRQSDDVRTEK